MAVVKLVNRPYIWAYYENYINFYTLFFLVTIFSDPSRKIWDKHATVAFLLFFHKFGRKNNV